jgi:hypothetical protein
MVLPVVSAITKCHLEICSAGADEVAGKEDNVAKVPEQKGLDSVNAHMTL